MIDEKIKGNGKTILSVDDQPEILMLYELILEKLGYRAITADNGKKAIGIYDEYMVASQNGQPPKSGIDLVILDMVMPGMEGPEVYDGLKKVDPDAKVLIASGYDVTEEVQKLLNNGAKGFIQKPFGVQSLSTKIREILGNGNIKPTPEQANDYTTGSVY